MEIFKARCRGEKFTEIAKKYEITASAASDIFNGIEKRVKWLEIDGEQESYYQQSINIIREFITLYQEINKEKRYMSVHFERKMNELSSLYKKRLRKLKTGTFWKPEDHKKTERILEKINEIEASILEKTAKINWEKRDFYAVDKEDSEYPICQILSSKGYLKGGNAWETNCLYLITEKGHAALNYYYELNNLYIP